MKVWKYIKKNRYRDALIKIHDILQETNPVEIHDIVKSVAEIYKITNDILGENHVK